MYALAIDWKKTGAPGVYTVPGYSCAMWPRAMLLAATNTPRPAASPRRDQGLEHLKYKIGYKLKKGQQQTMTSSTVSEQLLDGDIKAKNSDRGTPHVQNALLNGGALDVYRKRRAAVRGMQLQNKVIDVFVTAIHKIGATIDRCNISMRLR